MKLVNIPIRFFNKKKFVFLKVLWKISENKKKDSEKE